MSKRMKRGIAGGVSVATLAVLFLLTGLLGSMTPRGEAGESVRQIVLEARNLTFGEGNPTLMLEPGERVRLIVVNNDPGVLHSITLPGIDDRVYHVGWGEEVELEFTAPQQEGGFEYICPQHMPNMKGRIVVQESD